MCCVDFFRFYLPSYSCYRRKRWLLRCNLSKLLRIRFGFYRLHRRRKRTPSRTVAISACVCAFLTVGSSGGRISSKVIDSEEEGGGMRRACSLSDLSVNPSNRLLHGPVQGIFLSFRTECFSFKLRICIHARTNYYVFDDKLQVSAEIS